jgi:methionyl-tRNA formyltransferase
MRVVVLTGIRRGAASDYLPLLAETPGVEVVRIVLSENRALNRRSRLTRRLRKLRRVGLGGFLVSRILRRWDAGADGSEDLLEVARRHGIPVATTPAFNCERTRQLFREADAELGLALGTAILRRSVFGIPKHGMLNIHGAELPRFRGGHSVIWPIYEGDSRVGFSIHQIDDGIDSGGILHVETWPIEFGDSLRETYRRNVAEIRRRAGPALARVVGHHAELAPRPQAAAPGRTYTTPTLREFVAMHRQHARLRAAANR